MAQVTYDEHLAQLIKEELYARAERQGFQDAKTFCKLEKPMQVSSDPGEQRRYSNGFENGSVILRLEKQGVLR